MLTLLTFLSSFQRTSSVFKGQFLLLRKRFVRISNVYKYTKIFAFRQYFLQSFLNKDEKR